VSSAGWRTGRLRDVPAASELSGFSRDGYMDGMKARAPHILGRWADPEARFDAGNSRFHAVRGFLGVESFGVNASEAHKGDLLVVPTTSLMRANSRRSCISSSRDGCGLSATASQWS
jgi:hypothetical protein